MQVYRVRYNTFQVTMSSYRVRNNSVQVTIYAATGYDTLALEYDIILFWLRYEVTKYDITVLYSYSTT